MARVVTFLERKAEWVLLGANPYNAFSLIERLHLHGIAITVCTPTQPIQNVLDNFSGVFQTIWKLPGVCATQAIGAAPMLPAAHLVPRTIECKVKAELQCV